VAGQGPRTPQERALLLSPFRQSVDALLEDVRVAFAKDSDVPTLRRETAEALKGLMTILKTGSLPDDVAVRSGPTVKNWQLHLGYKPEASPEALDAILAVRARAAAEPEAKDVAADAPARARSGAAGGSWTAPEPLSLDEPGGASDLDASLFRLPRVPRRGPVELASSSLLGGCDEPDILLS
jgi:hypothetical protein